jgi:hypothetical protein
MPVVHAEVTRLSAGGSAVQRSFCMDARVKPVHDEGKNGKNERKCRRRNAARRNQYSAVASATAAPLRGEALPATRYYFS